jgi:transposase
MLKDASGFKHVYLAAGKTDLRKGQDSLLMIIKNEFELDPFESGNIFMFCGTRNHVIKALVFEEDGFVLMTKRLIRGRFQWPRDRHEVMEITEEQYRSLMDGFAVEYRSTIVKIDQFYL